MDYDLENVLFCNAILLAHPKPSFDTGFPCYFPGNYQVLSALSFVYLSYILRVSSVYVL